MLNNIRDWEVRLMVTKAKKNNKGFTLVELIVVLVILATLAAILVPTLLGYIDRAKQQKGVRKMHDIQVATTSALVEYYGINKYKVTRTFSKKTYTVNGSDVVGHSISNWTFSRLQKQDNSNNDCSDAIAKLMLNYLESNKNTKEKTYTFKDYTDSAYDKTASEIAKAGAEGLIIIFSEDCKLLAIQYSDLDGFLYTYDASKKGIKVEENGKFMGAGR